MIEVYLVHTWEEDGHKCQHVQVVDNHEDKVVERWSIILSQLVQECFLCVFFWVLL